MTVPTLITVPVISDERGTLGVLEGDLALPFTVRRVYFISEVPESIDRGAHAHRRLEQVVIAPTGSVRISLDDGDNHATFVLDSPSKALRIPPGYWRTLDDFAPGTVVVVLASEEYDEGDYIRDHARFIEWTHHG